MNDPYACPVCGGKVSSHCVNKGTYEKPIPFVYVYCRSGCAKGSGSTFMTACQSFRKKAVNSSGGR